MEKRKASPSVLSSIPKGSLPLQILSFVTIVMCLLVEELQKQVETLRGENKKLLQENQKLKQVEELQRQVETLTREKTKLLEENRKVKQDLGKKNANMEELRNEVAILREEKKHLQQRRELGIKKEEGQKKPTLWQNAKQKFHGLSANLTSTRTALDGSASRDKPQPVKYITEETTKEQNDDQAKASATCHCPMSCARESFLGLAEDICPRRALLDIYVLIALDLVTSLLKNKGRWTSLYDGFYKDVWEMCGSLKCNDFLPLLEKKKYIKLIIEIDRKNLKDISEIKKKLEAAFKKIVEAKDDCVVRHKGPQKLVEAIKYSCILVYVYKTDDGKTVKHCVRVRFDEACKVEKTQFIDSLKPETLENIVRKNLEKIQVLRLTENVHNLYQECGKHLCKEETCTKNAESMYARKKPRERRASAEW